ncbi:MAG: signal peptide peptidase SppA [Paracoccaceae bacterium]
MSIEAEVFEQAKKRARRTGFLFALLLIALALITLITLGIVFDYDKKSPHIARIKIDGPIFDDFDLNRLIYKLGLDPNVKAVIVHINSPGGSVVGAEATFVALSKLSEEKPSVAVLGETATSGGYLIAVAADQIISRSNTLTGSIGVILQYPNLSKLLKNIGIDINTLRSSDLKASINFFEKPTPKAIEEHKKVIEETFLWFKELVAERRKLTEINLKKVSQGGVFTGRKAKKLGLVDLIGGEREAVKYLEEKIDIKDVPLVDWDSSKESASLLDLIFRGGNISNLGKSLLSNSGFRLYSILF